ncbi:unnamed protein product [Urochloa humidicola]
MAFATRSGLLSVVVLLVVLVTPEHAVAMHQDGRRRHVRPLPTSGRLRDRRRHRRHPGTTARSTPTCSRSSAFSPPPPPPRPRDSPVRGRPRGGGVLPSRCANESARAVPALKRRGHHLARVHGDAVVVVGYDCYLRVQIDNALPPWWLRGGGGDGLDIFLEIEQKGVIE